MWVWPGSAQAVTSGPVPMVMIDPWLWLAGDCLTSHTEHHHITESNTSREQRAGPALTLGLWSANSEAGIDNTDDKLQPERQ